ncbi:cytochrome B561 [Bradyrhizobium sp. UNPF46]|uniref:cytochrome b n=1 Tax=Bradyrhizobium sp. UNPF46 TaxID=1141168 RepID=UPI0011670798|nr:cytochrome b [Bradyrhizobium sp. UNPF46]TQF26125.1 cytochrome B561 [Bradyrhizobium sp. UNPF46]
MTIESTSPSYAPLLRWIHWTTAILFIIAMLIGLYCGLQSPGTSPRRELLEVHKSLGETLLFLTILRLLVRAVTKAPSMPHDSSAFVRLAAGLNHLVLYGLLVAMPVTGYLFSSAGGYRLKYFGMFDLPRLFAGNQVVAHLGEAVHGVLAWLVYATVAAHIGATFWHAVVKKDDTLARMLPPRSAAGSVNDGS